MEIRIPNTKEVICMKRTGRFPFKQLVTDLLIDVISDSIIAAKDYVELTRYLTFCFGELQMHSIIIPALAKKVDSFILEYPIERRVGRENHSGRVDYYCRCNTNKPNEYHLFIELKSNKQSLPFNEYRKRSISLWKMAYRQIRGIGQEIRKNKTFYTKPVVCVCIETIVLYAHEAKNIMTSDIDAAIKVAQNDFSFGEVSPNLIVLWKCSNEFRENAQDEWKSNRKIYGIIFVCHIMKHIPPLKVDK